ncbi:MAG TPA: PTS IIA-like nitrogen regulatory protein PtsN [Geminicoccaceae bacterium]|nr:PTS IIA-like nitrogen regulatory protein PtsN [Geminicoccaceae bacterium]
MIDIADFLTPDRVVLDVKPCSKRQVLKQLAGRAAEATDLDCQRIFEVLSERERLGTTGIGGGIAIPHAKLPELDHLVGMFFRLDTPTDFDSVDDQPVDLIFLILAPDAGGADHLKALARVARLLREEGVCLRLRRLDDRDAVYRLLADKPESHAA